MAYGSFLGKKEICKLMLKHTIAKKYSLLKNRNIINNFGYIYIKFFGYPLDYIKRNRIRTILKKIPISEYPILDIGCSFGILVFELARRGFLVTGIDINSKNIELAKNIKKILKIGNAHFLRGDFLENDFEEKTFGVVIIIEVLEHIKDDTKTIQEIYRILKEGGILIISVPFSETPIEYDSPVPSLIINNKTIETGSMGEHHFRSGYNLKNLSGLLKSQGFKLLSYFYTNNIKTLSNSMYLFPFSFLMSSFLNNVLQFPCKLTILAKK